MLILGGALLMVGLYLFPLYWGQELFVNFLTDQSGGDETRGVVLAAIIAGLFIILAVVLLKRPALLVWLKNPAILVAVVIIAALMFVALGGL